MIRIKIIAECGVNYNSIEEAKEMIKRSKEVGCWASKFQLFTPEVAPNLPEHLYLSFDHARELFEYGKSIEHVVFFTPMYIEAIDFLETIDIEYYKVRYNDRWNPFLLSKIIKTNKPYFVSYSYEELRDHADLYIRQYEFEHMWPLFCVPKYPASFEDYKHLITYGYSDHCPDLKLLEFAKFHNALWFEKHVKLEGTKPLENEWSVGFSELEEIL